MRRRAGPRGSLVVLVRFRLPVLVLMPIFVVMAVLVLVESVEFLAEILGRFFGNNFGLDRGLVGVVRHLVRLLVGVWGGGRLARPGDGRRLFVLAAGFRSRRGRRGRPLMDQSQADVIADSEANKEGMDTCPH